MLECDYIVKQIDGDYAHLQRVDQPEAELKLVARALLPADIYEGCELHYAMMQYSMKCLSSQSRDQSLRQHQKIQCIGYGSCADIAFRN